jgi:hypothetical protein
MPAVWHRFLCQCLRICDDFWCLCTTASLFILLWQRSY